MNQEEYDKFLENITTLSGIIKSTPDDEKQTDQFKTTLESEISKLNEKAETFSQFVANDPAKYDSRIDDLKSSLSFYGDSFSNMLLPSIALVPAGYEPNQSAPVTPTDASQSPATQAPAAQSPAVTEPNQETLNAAFAKYMGSSFNPNSSMDKGKMETVKNALKKFQEENNKPFDINDSEDLTKMRPVMNAAYQSEEYKKVAGVGTRSASGGQGIGRAAATPRQQGTIQPKSLQLPVVGRGVEQMYVDKGGKFVPATDADYNSGQQLYAQKKKGTFDFLRSPKDRFQKVTRNRVERATRP
jgi:hypothetical protein